MFGLFSNSPRPSERGITELFLESNGIFDPPSVSLQEAWDVATDGYAYLGSDGSVLGASHKTKQLFGDLPSQQDLIKRLSPAGDPGLTERIHSSTKPFREKVSVASHSRGMVVAELEVIPVAAGRWLVFRLSEEKPVQQPLRDFSAAVFDSAEAIIVVMDRQGSCVRFNRRAQALTGYSESEVMGKSFLDLFVPPNEYDLVREELLRVVSGRYPSHNENSWVMRDGTVRTIAWSNTGLVDAHGNVEFVVSTGIDVTAARGAENAFASLSEQAMNQMQAERRKLSRFLHDTVSQDLVALSFSLNRLQEQDQKSEASLKTLHRSLRLLDRCCRDIRLLSYILSPPMFQEIGLIPALEWYGGQLQREAGMEVELHFDPLPDAPPSPEVQALLFAVLQACVARSVRHMDKSRKRIELKVNGSGAEPMIDLEYESFHEPDGSSHTQRQEFLEEFSVIRERLRLFKGKLEVEQGPDSVTVVASVPLRGAAYETH